MLTESPLLQTKLFVPQVRPGRVPRPRLLARLNQGVDQGNYQIQEIGGTRYVLFTADTDVTPIQVISLEPAPFAPASE